jgi:hypothetical protein
MKFRKIFFLIALMVNFAPFFALAQESAVADSLLVKEVEGMANKELDADVAKAKTPEEAVLKNLYAFAKDYSDLGKTKDKMKVLSYMSKDLVYNVVNFDVRNKHQLLQSDFSGFNTYLNKLLEEEGFVVNYKITEIVSNKVTDKLGVIVYNTEYETTSNGATWTKGAETVTMTFRKIGDKWKISYFTVIGREDETFRGTCVCELFKAAKGGYIAKTTVPAGRSYDSHMNNFTFLKSSGGRIYVKSDGKTYRWTSDGSIYLETPHDTSGLLIGKASQTTELEGIIEILKSSIFTVNCTAIKLVAR